MSHAHCYSWKRIHSSVFIYILFTKRYSTPWHTSWPPLPGGEAGGGCQEAEPGRATPRLLSSHTIVNITPHPSWTSLRRINLAVISSSTSLKFLLPRQLSKGSPISLLDWYKNGRLPTDNRIYLPPLPRAGRDDRAWQKHSYFSFIFPLIQEFVTYELKGEAIHPEFRMKRVEKNLRKVMTTSEWKDLPPLMVPVYSRPHM